MHGLYKMSLNEKDKRMFCVNSPFTFAAVLPLWCCEYTFLCHISRHIKWKYGHIRWKASSHAQYLTVLHCSTAHKSKIKSAHVWNTIAFAHKKFTLQMIICTEQRPGVKCAQRDGIHHSKGDFINNIADNK